MHSTKVMFPSNHVSHTRVSLSNLFCYLGLIFRVMLLAPKNTHSKSPYTQFLVRSAYSFELKDLLLGNVNL